VLCFLRLCSPLYAHFVFRAFRGLRFIFRCVRNISYKISLIKCIFLLFLKNCTLSFDCMNTRGTTPWLEEVEQCMAQYLDNKATN